MNRPASAHSSTVKAYRQTLKQLIISVKSSVYRSYIRRYSRAIISIVLFRSVVLFGWQARRQVVIIWGAPRLIKGAPVIIIFVPVHQFSY